MNPAQGKVFWLSVILFGGLFLWMLASPSKQKLEAAKHATSDCDASLWDHVYHPDRLLRIEDCVVVTGVIVLVRKEADGDKHIKLKLDAGYEGLLNEANNTEQDGCLVLEPICVTTPTQQDAIGPCVGYSNSVAIPQAGDRVSVEGSYVKDTKHGWNEIHPVSSISILSSGNATGATTTKPAGNSYYGVDSKGRTLYQGPRGGVFYYSASGSKVYVKH